MSLKLLVDMNLSPSWVDALTGRGIEAVHWSAIGDPRAADRDLMAWARAHGYVVFTHDLDFGAILAATQASGPSVIQIRTQDPSPARLVRLVAEALVEHAALLESGALIAIDEESLRARILPLSG